MDLQFIVKMSEVHNKLREFRNILHSFLLSSFTCVAFFMPYVESSESTCECWILVLMLKLLSWLDYTSDVSMCVHTRSHTERGYLVCTQTLIVGRKCQFVLLTTVWEEALFIYLAIFSLYDLSQGIAVVMWHYWQSFRLYYLQSNLWITTCKYPSSMFQMMLFRVYTVPSF